MSPGRPLPLPLGQDLREIGGLPLVSPSAGSAPHPRLPSRTRPLLCFPPKCLGGYCYCQALPSDSRDPLAGQCGGWAHVPPRATCFLPGGTPQPGVSQADTMGRAHIRFMGKENYSLWTKKSGQDIYNCLKKSLSAAAPSPSTSEMSQHSRLFKYPNPE